MITAQQPNVDLGEIKLEAAIARLSNDQLLKMIAAIEELSRGISNLYSLPKEMQQERSTLVKQVEQVRTALDQERATRIFRYWVKQFQRLQKELQQPPQERTAFRLIPHPAITQGSQDQQEGEEEETNGADANQVEQVIQTATAMLAE